LLSEVLKKIFDTFLTTHHFIVKKTSVKYHTYLVHLISETSERKVHVSYISSVYSKLSEMECMDVCLISMLTNRQPSMKTELKL